MSPDAKQDFGFAFLSLLFEGAPFILLGTLISGLLEVYLPSGAMDRMLPKRKGLAILVAGLLGVIFPVCECAVVPVIRRLVKKGLPVSCGLTYMLAAPILNPITALSTWKAFQGQEAGLMTFSRLGMGFLVAVGVGWWVSRKRADEVLRAGVLVTGVDPEEEAVCDHDHAGCCGHHGKEGKLLAAFRSAMRDFVDVGAYFSIGVVLTALFNTGIAPGAEHLDSLAGNTWLAAPVLMGLAFVLSLCSTSDAFIAATLHHFSSGAKLAFLVFGPMLDVKLLFLYQSVMRKRFVVQLAVVLFVAITVLCLAWEKLFGQMG